MSQPEIIPGPKVGRYHCRVNRYWPACGQTLTQVHSSISSCMPHSFLNLSCCFSHPTVQRSCIHTPYCASISLGLDPHHLLCVNLTGLKILFVNLTGPGSTPPIVRQSHWAWIHTTYCASISLGLDLDLVPDLHPDLHAFQSLTLRPTRVITLSRPSLGPEAKDSALLQ